MTILSTILELNLSSTQDRSIVLLQKGLPSQQPLQNMAFDDQEKL